MKKFTKIVSLTQPTHKRWDQFGSASARTPLLTKASAMTNGGAGGEARRRLGTFAAAGASSSPPLTPVPARDEFRDALSSPWTGVTLPSSGDKAPRCIWDVDLLTSNTVQEHSISSAMVEDDIAGALVAAPERQPWPRLPRHPRVPPPNGSRDRPPPLPPMGARPGLGRPGEAPAGVKEFTDMTEEDFCDDRVRLPR